jgi:hypothetical protein
MLGTCVCVVKTNYKQALIFYNIDRVSNYKVSSQPQKKLLVLLESCA